MTNVKTPKNAKELEKLDGEAGTGFTVLPHGKSGKRVQSRVGENDDKSIPLRPTPKPEHEERLEP